MPDPDEQPGDITITDAPLHVCETSDEPLFEVTITDRAVWEIEIVEGTAGQ